MNIVTNIIKILIAILIIVAIFVPKIYGIPTALIFAFMGLVLFMIGVYMHIAKSQGDTINRAEFHGLGAFVLGWVMATGDRVKEIISMLAQIGLVIE